LSGGNGPEVRFAGFGTARTAKGMMAAAMAPAGAAALADAGVEVGDLKAVKTHNPFALNDVLLARELGVDPELINNFGSPLVWGHPQAPTATRALIELIEELEIRGGGFGLFSGCAAGDTAAGCVVEVR
jgi:acetyl-CoA acetyltransferase